MATEVLFNFKTPEITNIITLPIIAVNEDISGEKYVYTIENLENKQGIVTKKKVTIGKIINNRIETLSGLNKNERVITAGASKVIVGQKVKLYEEVK